MNEHIQQHDAIIIGGGLTGLAVASYLARAGRKVTLFEKAASLGGRAASQEHDGYYLNLGGHALLADSPATQVLDELGVRYTGGSPKKLWAVRDGKLHILPADPISLFRTGLLSRAAKWEAIPVLLGLQTMKPDDVQGVSLRDWMQRSVKAPEVRTFIEAAARVSTYSNAPDILSIGHFVEQLRANTKSGVVYIDHGWQTLVDGLRGVAERSGAAIVAGSKVEAVEYNGRGVTGVRLSDGSVYSAGAVIMAASPREASDLVDRGSHPTLRGWAERSVPAQFACLDVTLRRLSRPDRQVVLGIDTPLFHSAQSVYSDVAPEGGAVIYTFKYLDPSRPTDPKDDRRELEGWLDLIQPGWREQVVEARFLPHLVVSNAIVTAAQGGTAGRPGPEVPGVPGLYVAGDWVGPKGMLAGAALWSARLAARQTIAQREHADLTMVA